MGFRCSTWDFASKPVLEADLRASIGPRWLHPTLSSQIKELRHLKWPIEASRRSRFGHGKLRFGDGFDGKSSKSFKIFHKRSKKIIKGKHTSFWFSDGFGGFQSNRGPKHSLFYRKHVFQSGAWYEGDWLGAERSGFGLQVWPDGAYYKGFWQQNMASGKGVFKHSNGVVYVGQWRRGLIGRGPEAMRGRHSQAHGIGTYNDEEGISYAGGLSGSIASTQGIANCSCLLIVDRCELLSKDQAAEVRKVTDRLPLPYPRGQRLYTRMESRCPNFGIEGVRV